MNCVLIYDIIDRLYTHINYLAPKTVMEIILTLRYFGINGQHHSDKASKQNAVNILRETYGFKRVVGFGDNLNDLPMFAECDIKVAPRNAKPEFVLSDFFKVTFRRNAPESSIGRQSAVNRPQSATAADRESIIKMFIKQHGQAKVSDLTDVVDLSEGRVRDLLRKMASDGVIEKNGKNRYTYYTLKS